MIRPPPNSPLFPSTPLFRPLPELVQARANRRSLRIWCAASSTGQEPYSIAMCIKEFAPLTGWRVEIVATDLSQGVLEKSKAGRSEEHTSELQSQSNLVCRLL